MARPSLEWGEGEWGELGLRPGVWAAGVCIRLLLTEDRGVRGVLRPSE